MLKEKYFDFFFLISLFFIVVNQPVCVEFEYQHFTQKINSKDNQYKILDDFATLSGNFLDFGLDKDSDGHFDYLVLEIEVDVTVAGTYWVHVSGLRDSSGNIISVSDSNTTYLDMGLQTVQIYLAGQAIYGQGLNPTEIWDIYLYDDSSNKLGELDHQLLSQSYSYTDFNVIATLSGNFTDFGLDKDSDGHFDYLVLEIEVNVTVAGTYWVHVSGLRDSSGNIISVSDSNTTYLDMGLQTVQIYLAGQAIYGQGLNPTEIWDIYLYDDSSNKLGELDHQLLSQPYPYTDFNGPAILSGNFTDFGFDEDSDGQFDYLVLEIEVDVTVAGTYWVHVSGLRDSSGNIISVSDSNTTYLDMGLQTVQIYLAGQAIYGQGLNPTEIWDIYLYDDSSNKLGELDHQLLSQSYSYTDFNVIATLSGNFTDFGFDEDSDGQFDYLVLEIEVDVTVAGTYWVHVSGLRDSSGNIISVSDSNTTYLDMGLQTVQIYLAGQAIYGQGLDPTEIWDIYLYDDSSNKLGELDHQPLSQTYLHSHFGNEFLITNPTNILYNNNDIWLNFTINLATNWIGFSLDEAPNATIFDNVLLTNLAEGVHNVVLFAQDINNNYFSSIPIWFTIDTIAPILTVNNPSNKTYSTNYIDVNASANELTSWIGYSIDGGINTTLLENNNIVYLPDGSHTIIFYAIDLAGNEVKSSENSFTIDTQSPVISILNPQNDYYNYQSLWVNFTINEPTDWIGYKLDNQAIVTINGNFFLQDLPEGDHALTLYANDSLGFLGNSEIKLTIDITPPIITILKPENITYISQEIEINFIISEPASFIYYSLDGKSNVSITEALFLSISEGEHFIVMYASDRAGNVNKSEKIWFTLEYPPNITTTGLSYNTPTPSFTFLLTISFVFPSLIIIKRRKNRKK